MMLTVTISPKLGEKKPTPMPKQILNVPKMTAVIFYALLCNIALVVLSHSYFRFSKSYYDLYRYSFNFASDTTHYCLAQNKTF